MTKEVTQGMWSAVMHDFPSTFGHCGDCPVESVSWDDIQLFIKKLNHAQSTWKYRLPSEAEWEYAARAGTSTPFWTGKCLGQDQANYHGEYPLQGCPKGGYLGKTVPVAGFNPNPWGLYDMHGNVEEWCEDWYGGYPPGAAIDPCGTESGSGRRVIRGCKWYDHAEDCRSASRSWVFSNNRSHGRGFRLIFSQGQ